MTRSRTGRVSSVSSEHTPTEPTHTRRLRGPVRELWRRGGRGDRVSDACDSSACLHGGGGAGAARCTPAHQSSPQRSIQHRFDVEMLSK